MAGSCNATFEAEFLYAVRFTYQTQPHHSHDNLPILEIFLLGDRLLLRLEGIAWNGPFGGSVGKDDTGVHGVIGMTETIWV